MRSRRGLCWRRFDGLRFRCRTEARFNVTDKLPDQQPGRFLDHPDPSELRDRTGQLNVGIDGNLGPFTIALSA